MKTIRFALAGLLLSLALARSAAATPPAYLHQRAGVPQPAAATPGYAIPYHRYDRGFVYPAPATGYAYGWFGVAPRQHWSRHFGYYRQYTEWSAR